MRNSVDPATAFIFPALLFLSLYSAPATAQQVDAPVFWSEVPAGSEAERYLRALQVAGRADYYPFGLRAFSRTELTRIGPDANGHPWSSRVRFGRGPGSGEAVEILRADLGIVANSGFPYGENDGAVWAGRGVTATASGGFAVRRGPLSVVVAPLAFWAQNAEFRSAPGVPAFSDAVYPFSIDQPQRFGADSYGRFDWGQSTLRLEAAGIQLGLSTANQVWGPAAYLPLVLGVNAPGFPHAFLGTSHALSNRLGSVQARALWGALEQSAHSPEDVYPRRLMAGWVIALSPALLEGLEVGATRFQHLEWPKSGEWTENLLRPFEGFLKEGVLDSAEESNQLVSIFARWVYPASGFELYGEYAREDHSFNARDFVLLPDHTGGYVFGLAKVWRPSDERWWQLRTELLNSARSQTVRIRFHGPFYVHHALRQGHTHRGQVLGSPATLGGGGARLLVDRYDPDGRWTVELARRLQGGDVSTEWAGVVYPEPVDVLYEVGVERLLFRGSVEYALRLSGVYNLDRYRESDAVNLTAALSATFDPRTVRRRE